MIVPNPEVERELAKIKGIGVFGSILTKPLGEAGDIDLAIGCGLTTNERRIVQGISNKYNKKIEVFQGDEVYGLLEGDRIGKQLFSPYQRPKWDETYVGEGFFEEIRPPESGGATSKKRPAKRGRSWRDPRSSVVAMVG